MNPWLRLSMTSSRQPAVPAFTHRPAIPSAPVNSSKTAGCSMTSGIVSNPNQPR
jgi:hypothetical protein